MSKICKRVWGKGIPGGGCHWCEDLKVREQQAKARACRALKARLSS